MLDTGCFWSFLVIIGLAFVCVRNFSSVFVKFDIFCCLVVFGHILLSLSLSLTLNFVRFGLSLFLVIYSQVSNFWSILVIFEDF